MLKTSDLPLEMIPITEENLSLVKDLRGEQYAEQFRYQLSLGDFGYYAYYEGKPVGYGWAKHKDSDDFFFKISDGCVYLCRFFVHESMRGHGIYPTIIIGLIAMYVGKLEGLSVKKVSANNKEEETKKINKRDKLMKLLKLSSYYTPELISSTHLSKDLEEAYLDAGFTIDVYCPTPTRGISKEVRKQYKKIKYEEMQDGKIIVRRFSMFREGKNPIMRALRYVLVNIKQYHKGSRAKDVDVIMSGSTPPTQGVLCGMVKKKLAKRYKKYVPYVYNLQDVFPDSLVTTGLAKKGSLLWKIGRKIENYTYKSADKIIVISESMKRNIMEKGVPEEKITVVSNWIDTEEVQPVSKENNRLYEEFGISRDKFTVLYAGNFGAAQGADVVLKAAEALQDQEDVQFVIFGGGSGYAKAEETVKEKGLNNVIINKLLPQERVPEVYSLGDVAIITCKKGVGNSGMPSKTWSIMACNTPIIAAFDTDSELAEILNTSGTGICVEPEDEQVLAKAILDMKNTENRPQCGREYVLKHASKEVCVQKYVDVILSVSSANTSTPHENQ